MPSHLSATQNVHYFGESASKQLLTEGRAVLVFFFIDTHTYIYKKSKSIYVSVRILNTFDSR